MKLRISLVAIVLFMGLVACGPSKAYKNFLKAAKETVCENEKIIQQLESDPENRELNLKLKLNNDWIDFYIKESGKPERFKKELKEHTCK